jgi:glycosyltransferase involved in cell wall biosynthesis
MVRRILSKTEGFGRNKWFGFSPAITMSYVTEVRDKYVEDADIVIATWWSTVLEMGALSPSKGKKINLIQGFENWEGHEDLLYSSYDMKNTINIVVASYLEEIVRQHTNNRIELIENGVDNALYYIRRPIEDSKPATMAMMYSKQEIKGSKYGLEALEIVKGRIPDLEVELFGISSAPEILPCWMRYYRDPDDLCDLYNRNAIFISNSFTEGFGLVSVESMFCGCALVCTNIKGHQEYAFDNETALLTEVANPSQMADRICYLIENKDYCIDLAQRGNAYVQRFSWENSIEKMEDIIKNIL